MLVRDKIFSLFLAKIASRARAAFAKQNPKLGFLRLVDVGEQDKAQRRAEPHTGCDYHLEIREPNNGANSTLASELLISTLLFLHD